MATGFNFQYFVILDFNAKNLKRKRHLKALSKLRQIDRKLM